MRPGPCRGRARGPIPAGKPLGRAVVASVDGENVTLRKPDMSEATVPIASLGKNDQNFLKPLKKDIAEAGVLPEAGESPAAAPVEQFPPCKEFASPAVAPADSEKQPALAPDPLPKYILLQPGSATCSTAGFFDEVATVLSIGGKDSLVLAALEEGMPGRSNPTRLLWASLTQQKIVGQQSLPPSEIVLDYFPPGHRLLTYRGARECRGAMESSCSPCGKCCRPTGGSPRSSPGTRTLRTRECSSSGRDSRPKTLWSNG